MNFEKRQNFIRCHAPYFGFAPAKKRYADIKKAGKVDYSLPAVAFFSMSSSSSSSSSSRSGGSGELQLYMKAGGSRYPASVETVQNNWHTIMWDGHAVFKAAVSKMADVSVEIMERNGLTSADVRYLVPHQANLRIIDATARRMGLEHEKCMINIDRNGNTTAATIPSCLYDYEKELRKGDNLILSAFGGGYTWGAIYVKWAYDGSKACQIDSSEK